jgi:hypothetical protein
VPETCECGVQMRKHARVRTYKTEYNRHAVWLVEAARNCVEAYLSAPRVIGVIAADISGCDGYSASCDS